MNSKIEFYSKKLNAGKDALSQYSPLTGCESIIFDFDKTCSDVGDIPEVIRKYKADRNFIGYMPGKDKQCLQDCCIYLEKFIFDLASADSEMVQKNYHNTPEMHFHNTNYNELKSTSTMEVNVSVLFNQTIKTVDSLEGLSNEEKREVKSLLEELTKNNSNPVIIDKIINYMKKGYKIAVALSPLVSQFVPNLHLCF